MGTGQREPRLGCVIEAPTGPAVRIVALGAGGAEPSLMVSVLVAGGTGLRCVLELGGAMALLAGDGLVQADEGKARDVMIEHDLLAPASVLVAFLAGRSELSLMRVVLLVAGSARRCEFVAIEVAGMTGTAFGGRVLAVEREFGGLVMVERNRRPLRGGVAGFAFGPKPARMLVLDGVAAVAGKREAFILFAGVTGRARCVAMGAGQRKFGLGVIEGLGPMPGLDGVAVLAGGAEIAFVSIGLAMAVDACSRRLAEFDVWRVATAARGGGMRTGELEVGCRMVEGFAIQLDDVERPALVVGVAVLAVRRRRSALAAVKAALLGAICSNVFVAIEAALGLRLFLEFLVALAAIVFELGMPLNHRTGIDQLFKQRLRAGLGHARQREQDQNGGQDSGPNRAQN